MTPFLPPSMIHRALRALALSVLVGLLAACAGQPSRTATAPAPADEAVAKKLSTDEAGAANAGDAALPNQELTGETVYEFLLAEIAGQRGNATLSAQAYADLARRTKDPRVAERNAHSKAALHARRGHGGLQDLLHGRTAL